MNAKGNWQATSRGHGVGAVVPPCQGEDRAIDLATAASPAMPQTATWFQGGSYVDGRPHGLTKIEDNHVFNSNLFVSGKYAYYNTGFGLEPLGGLGHAGGQSQVLNQSFGSTRQSLNIRPQHIVNVDANYFRNALGASHDFKFGFGWRRTRRVHRHAVAGQHDSRSRKQHQPRGRQPSLASTVKARDRTAPSTWISTSATRSRRVG